MTEVSLVHGWAAVVRRDLLLAARRPADLGTIVVFFVIVVSLFPLGLGPEPELLRAIAPGVVWVAALLASLLAFSRLFAADLADGTLEQMVLSPQPLALVVLAKVFAHWIATGLPLVLVGPLLGLQYGLPPAALGIMALALLLGTPVLSLVGAIGAALTLGVRGATTLAALLTLPLFVPVLIFGAGAVAGSLSGLGSEGQLELLGAFLLLALACAPWACAAAVRIALE